MTLILWAIQTVFSMIVKRASAQKDRLASRATGNTKSSASTLCGWSVTLRRRGCLRLRSMTRKQKSGRPLKPAAICF
jgi:hypothetical protein